ncbi:hypothetical protein XH97_01485 [Bradyrhizobium sp. CCBAU 53380]|nr:hypothetical protein [Bradyrhizobium sp. CCBAU 53380]
MSNGSWLTPANQGRPIAIKPASTTSQKASSPKRDDMMEAMRRTLSTRQHLARSPGTAQKSLLLSGPMASSSCELKIGMIESLQVSRSQVQSRLSVVTSKP